MLTVTQLSFGYQQRPLFRGLDLTVRPGELIVVRGNNGVGKSTLLALLAGLHTPWQGHVTFSVDDRKTREQFAYLAAESNGHFLELSAMHNLIFWQKMRDRRADLPMLLGELERWNLGQPFIATMLAVGRFSTGMKRRLALCRLALSGARCWLLDEPVSGLDQDAIRTFQDQLRRHLEQDRGFAIMVSHDPQAYLGLPHRVFDLTPGESR